ncbi:MAG: hypothetical protein K8F91_07630 [Candidatus Obscuribacterales bacterium]|nr:hypothetical protein [Candidatus Obscuribacterales bacterium]
MKKLRISILIGGLLFMFSMCLYPPWVYQDNDGKQQPMGYGFLWAPPKEGNDKSANVMGFKLNVELGSLKANAIDLGRLFQQEGIAAIIVFGAAMLCKESSRPERQ